MHAYHMNVLINMCTSALTALSAKSGKETSDGFDGEDTSCPLSVGGICV